jgi:hypothetical protein
MTEQQLIRPYPGTIESHKDPIAKRSLINLRALRQTAFRFYLVAALLAGAGMYLPVNYVQDYAARIGLQESYVKVSRSDCIAK